MSEYRDTAQKRTVVQQLQRLLLDRYIAADSPPKETLTCEEVFVNESQVSQDVLLSIYQDLEVWENALRQQMNEYGWRKNEKKLPFLKDEKKQPPPAEAKKNGTDKKSKGKRKKDAEEAGVEEPGAGGEQPPGDASPT